ncbi:MAG: MerR family transcriptional regulator [Anaerolineae bacterium]|nr:MerR family transcriptional regulator [Anaerolineae bacterium]
MGYSSHVPSATDPDSGYRLYALDQLTDMMRILALKDCGFALDDITGLLHTHDREAVARLVDERIRDQRRVVDDEQARLQRLIARSHQLTALDKTVQYDFVIKQTEAYTLVGRRQIVHDRSEIKPFVHTVLGALEAQFIVPGHPLVHLYFDYTEDAIDLFVGAPVMALPPSLDGLECWRIAAGEPVASVLHRGDYATVSQAGMALAAWIHRSGYHHAGPLYEIYHRNPLQTNNPADYLTELQFPISESQSNSPQEQPS